MILPWTLLIGLPFILASNVAKRNYETHNYYVLEHIPNSGTSLDDVANELGVEIMEQAGQLAHHWVVRTSKPIKQLLARDSTTQEIDPVLETFDSLRRQAAQDTSISSRSTASAVVSSVNYLARQIPRQRVKRAPPLIKPTESSLDVATKFGIKDPLFQKQWHLVNDEFPEHMMNVVPVWAMGITGKGVISAMVDDGLDYTSEDLMDNFDAYGSYDFNDHEALPTPKLGDDHHGTRCAGQIAAGKNTVCGMGIAYESKIAGIRILSGPISDVDEAAALNYGYQNTSIYSCSWGPPDNGAAMEGPEHLIKKAMVEGINRGRGGKGSIFVFASGNGAAHGDNCNMDVRYTNSIYSVTVSAVDYKGLHPYYSEPCAANMIVAYSSGSGQHIVTTDRGVNACATTHGGTSAAAPNAAGVFALALQARPELTWRDVQYLCLETAGMINPEDPDWQPTAAGRPYSYKYGYGVLNAAKYIVAARDWKLVKPQAYFLSDPVQLQNGTMDDKGVMSGGAPIVPNGGVRSTMLITKEMLINNNFERLEQIDVRVWISHTRRGDVEFEIVSPNGFKSVLAAPRVGDLATTGYPGWKTMTVKHWGEDPIGEWTIRVSDQGGTTGNGSFLGWNMMFWGEAIDAARATKFELEVESKVFPPVFPHPEIPSGTTKDYPHPSSFLDPSHGHAEGENSKIAFPAATFTATASASASGTLTSAISTSTPTPDEGWFSGMSNLVTNQKWFFGAVGVVIVFGLIVGFFFWRRRIARKRRENYSTLPADELPMSATAVRPAPAGGPRTKELYDAFGEVSDDEDDADEGTRLRGNRPFDNMAHGTGFHSGFLDDDEPPSRPSPSYRDEPDQSATPTHRPVSPTEANGSDGSWELEVGGASGSGPR